MHELLRTLLLTAVFVLVSNSTFALPIEFEIKPTPGSQTGMVPLKVLSNGDFLAYEQFENVSGLYFNFYLFDGKSGRKISTIRSGRQWDSTPFFSKDDFHETKDGRVYFAFSNWDSEQFRSAGAVVEISRVMGFDETINATNALTGSSTNARVGSGFAVLENGNVVFSGGFVESNETFSGATLCRAEIPCIGSLSPANSFVSNSPISITPLSDSKLVLSSPLWDGEHVDQGAVTRIDGEYPLVGTFNSLNSFVGDVADQKLGLNGVKETRDGNFLIITNSYKSRFSKIEGAVTFVASDAKTAGKISPRNSLFGTGARYGNDIVKILSTGDYVVSNPSWNEFRGFSLIADGSEGVTGVVDNEVALVGSPLERVGHEVYELREGRVAVTSPLWNEARGAVTVLSVDKPIVGEITASNSVVGMNRGDQIASGDWDTDNDDSIQVLANGNFLIYSPYFEGQTGAITLIEGIPGVSRVVSKTNSLIGSKDVLFLIGALKVHPLQNGNFVVLFNTTNSGPQGGSLAFFGKGDRELSGTPGGDNSIVGLTAATRIIEVDSDSYLIEDTNFDGKGAVVIGDSNNGTVGFPNENNSFFGISAEFRIYRVRVLRDGYVAVGFQGSEIGGGENFGLTILESDELRGFDVSNENLTRGPLTLFVDERSINLDAGNGRFLAESTEIDTANGKCSAFTYLSKNPLLRGRTSDDNTLNIDFPFSQQTSLCNSQVLLEQENFNRVLAQVPRTGIQAFNLEHQEKEVSIGGTVISRNRVPVPNAMITIQLENGKEITVRSNQFGRFSTPTFDGSKPVTITTKSRNHNFPVIRERVQWSLRNIELVAN